MRLSQLSRAVETRKESKMPQLSDLRESGAIEQDADMVMFIYRPEYYEQMANENGESTRGETHIRIAKHRNGSLETIKLRALLHIQKFEEWEGDGGADFRKGAAVTGNLLRLFARRTKLGRRRQHCLFKKAAA